MKSIQLNFCLVFGLLAIASLVHVQYVSADYQVKVQLFTFENPTHQYPRPLTDPPVFCCDGLPGDRPQCTDDICDIYIVLCLNPFGLSPVSDNRINRNGDTNCDNDTVKVSEVFKTPNTTMNDDDITFDVGETALLGLPNPFIFNQTGEWPGGIQLVVQVFDDDSNINSTDSNNFDESLQSVIINIDQLGASPPTLMVGAEGVGMMNVSYEVTCTENFYGPNCTTFCDGDLGRYTCGSNGERICINNYYGPNCTIICEERDDEQGHYTCDSEGNIVCKDGYNDTSTNCTECIPADGCSPVGGYCREGNECVCHPEYTGDLCESDLTICHQITCQNGGTCMNTGPDMYKCMCPEEFEGVNCEFDRTDECDPDPCKNGATCMDLFMNYTCECVDGYEGRDCDVDINECDNNPCQNGGSCMNLVADYSCNCPLGFIGKNCEREEGEGEGEGNSSEGVDAATLVGGVVGIVVLILIILVLVIVLVFLLRKQRHRKVQIITDVQQELEPAEYETFSMAKSDHEKKVVQQNTGSSIQHDFDNPLYDESLPKNNHAAPTTVTQPEIYYSSVTNPSSSLQAPGPTLEYDYTENPSGKGGSLSVYDSADDPTTSQAVYARPEAPPMGTTNGASPIHDYDYAFTDKPVYADPDSQVPPPAAERFEMVPTTAAADHYEFGPDFDS